MSVAGGGWEGPGLMYTGVGWMACAVRSKASLVMVTQGPPEQNHRQTPVKTLHSRNFVGGQYKYNVPFYFVILFFFPPFHVRDSIFEDVFFNVN